MATGAATKTIDTHRTVVHSHPCDQPFQNITSVVMNSRIGQAADSSNAPGGGL
ncbi:hypothetical protein GCM10009839_14440 [Catenulispora yoronensis]|uniref:Uncharacterized protein n=1 Tax=Catenulispora yoronensis TaxID=450799 RepID=A0ABN2TT69_9ACTN